MKRRQTKKRFSQSRDRALAWLHYPSAYPLQSFSIDDLSLSLSVGYTPSWFVMKSTFRWFILLWFVSFAVKPHDGRLFGESPAKSIFCKEYLRSSPTRVSFDGLCRESLCGFERAFKLKVHLSSTSGSIVCKLYTVVQSRYYRMVYTSNSTTNSGEILKILKILPSCPVDIIGMWAL